MLQRRSINRSALKTYAPKARSEFIAGVTARAAKFGITKDRVVEATPQGDLVIIGAEAFSRGVGERRQKLLQRIALDGFEQTMEEVAYTWFNRFLAIRFMELHGYLEHGYRVLSHPGDKELPEILEHAEHLELPGLDKSKVIDLKLDGTKDAELYRLLLIAQCNALHRAMPFLFEKIDDETELLLPDNLLHTDSLIRKLVSAIDEVDWQEIEIIGWLYQFYISEKKDEVIGKVVKSEDIPAATQLFTPNWIVKYMVQNALGAQWLATYPDSPLKAEMQYYVEPAEQTEEVKRQLAEITPKELNPEELTVIDPACGSGHILVEAYDLFKAIYLERGYRLRDIPRLILEKNLYGLDIDDRAAQMAGFALLMKARADDRRILSSESAPVMHVMAIQDSKGLDSQRLAQTLLPRGRFELVPSNDLLPDTLAQPTLSAEQPSPVQVGTIAALLDLFAEGKTFGSLITVPAEIAGALPALKTLIQPDERDDIFQREAKQALAPLVDQAELLSRQYDAVVANPPYMGAKYFTATLKKFAKISFISGGEDIYSCFIERNMKFSRKYARLSMIVIPNWMFISTFSDFRKFVLSNYSIQSLSFNGRGIWGADFGSVAFTIINHSIPPYIGRYKRLFDRNGEVQNTEAIRDRFLMADKEFFLCQRNFFKVPTQPFAFWITQAELDEYEKGRVLESLAQPKKGMDTGENAYFLRLWQEVSRASLSANDIHSGDWVPYNKGGDYRKWYGNREWLLRFAGSGAELKQRLKQPNKKPNFRNERFYGREGYTWTTVTMAKLSSRYCPHGAVFDNGGATVFADEDLHVFGAYLNSCVAQRYLEFLSPSVNYQPGDIGRLLYKGTPGHGVGEVARELVALAKADWDAYETSWDFQVHPLLSQELRRDTVESAYAHRRSQSENLTAEMQRLEERNNSVFIHAYQLQNDLIADVPLREVTLTCNPHYRYGGEFSDGEREARLCSDTMRELVSFAVGCMMGRYSLAEPGLIYANAANQGFDSLRYGPFPADEDGIVPITEMEWFGDDAAARFEEFLKVAWSPEALRENLRFVAEGLAENGGSDARKLVRNYFAKEFFRHHLQTYQRRPIYWLFSSGKLKAFECLVYLHRYNESTLSRMRMEYVVPLQSRMAARIDQLGDDVASASSSAARTKAQKEKDLLARQLEELRAFDEELRHYADQRIALDLDEGVKVNYGKFGNLLAERKAVTGEK